MISLTWYVTLAIHYSLSVTYHLTRRFAITIVLGTLLDLTEGLFDKVLERLVAEAELDKIVFVILRRIDIDDGESASAQRSRIIWR